MPKANTPSVKQDMPVLPKPPKAASRSRKLLYLLLLFFVVLLVVLFFQSSLSKIALIKVTGNDSLPQAEILAASGLAAGDNFFKVSSGTVKKRISALHMVKNAVISKKFPGIVSIHIEEFPRVAYQFNEKGKLGAVLADGTFVVQTQLAPPDKPILTGWKADNPEFKKLCETLAAIPANLTAPVSEIKPAPSTAYPDKIKLYIRSDYEVYTTIGYLPDKIKSLQAYIDNLRDKGITSGTLTLLEADSHSAFETPEKTDGKEATTSPVPSATPSKQAPTPSPSVKSSPKPTSSLSANRG